MRDHVILQAPRRRVHPWSPSLGSLRVYETSPSKRDETCLATCFHVRFIAKVSSLESPSAAELSRTGVRNCITGVTLFPYKIGGQWSRCSNRDHSVRSDTSLARAEVALNASVFESSGGLTPRPAVSRDILDLASRCYELPAITAEVDDFAALYGRALLARHASLIPHPLEGAT